MTLKPTPYCVVWLAVPEL